MMATMARWLLQQLWQGGRRCSGLGVHFCSLHGARTVNGDDDDLRESTILKLSGGSFFVAAHVFRMHVFVVLVAFCSHLWCLQLMCCRCGECGVKVYGGNTRFFSPFKIAVHISKSGMAQNIEL